MYVRQLTNENNASDRVVEYIEQEIICGKLNKGEKLPTERKLAEDMSVSRASVREAMRALEVMGIVNSIQGSGNYITVSPETTVDRSLCALFALNDGTLENLMQIREMLEMQALGDGVNFAGDKEIARVAALADYDYDINDVNTQAQFDEAFHSGLISLSRNTMVKYLYTTLLRLIRYYRNRVFVATLERKENYITRRDHFRIAAALSKRDLPELETALKEHLELNEHYRRMLNVSFRNIV